MNTSMSDTNNLEIYSLYVWPLNVFSPLISAVILRVSDAVNEVLRASAIVQTQNYTW